MILKKDSSGFTLIELMVVIVIIGVLISIALPNYIYSEKRAKIASLKSNARTLQVAVEAYNIDNNFYPSSITDIISSKAYKTFKNPFTNADDVADTSGLNGSWRTNDDGAVNASSDLINYADKDKSKGLVIYVGLDSAGAATTQFSTPDGTNSGNSNKSTNYLIYACDDQGIPSRAFLLHPGVLPDKQETKDFEAGKY